jgi:4-amino-4-deoxy-L-arabinose transferase-like glycosyltransferase
MKYLNAVITICLLAFVLRVAFILAMPQAPIGGDAAEYDAIAMNLAAGHGFGIVPDVPTPIRAPFYPMFLALLYAVFGHSYLIVLLMQAALGAVTCAAVYGVARPVWGTSIARGAALATALYPALIAYCGYVLSETLFTLLFVLSTLLLIKMLYENGRVLNAIAGGVLMGLATLTRPATMLFPAFLAAALIGWQAIKIDRHDLKTRGKAGLKRTALAVCLFAAASYLTIVPWTLRNYLTFHKVIPVATGGGFGTWATAYAVRYQVSWTDAIEASHRRVAGWMGEPKSVANGYHPRVQLDEELLVEAKEMLRGNYVRYAGLMAARLPRFWVTSHSSLFGIARPYGEYRAEGAYAAIVGREMLFALQTVVVFLAVMGIVIALRDRRDMFLFGAILFYFCGHIALDPLPRYHVPVLPYAFMFAIYAASRIISRKGNLS